VSNLTTEPTLPNDLIPTLTTDPTATLTNNPTLSTNQTTIPTGDFASTPSLSNDLKRCRDEPIEINDEIDTKKMRIEKDNENEKNNENNINKDDFLPVGVISGYISTLQIANNVFKTKNSENNELFQLFPLYTVEIQNTGAGGSIGMYLILLNLCITYLYIHVHIFIYLLIGILRHILVKLNYTLEDR
jgi:hypothetical protein